MKRWLLVGIPLVILGGLLFLKPPAFTGGKSPSTPGTSQTTVKPGIPGGSDENGGEKPSYGGHESDEYGKPIKK